MISSIESANQYMVNSSIGLIRATIKNRTPLKSERTKIQTRWTGKTEKPILSKPRKYVISLKSYNGNKVVNPNDSDYVRIERLICCINQKFSNENDIEK